jgi:hypothetical protein
MMHPIHSGRFNALTLISSLTAAYTLCNLLSFATLILEVPTVRLFEKAVCNRYYRSHHQPGQFLPSDVTKSQCKVGPVQDTLANIIGWQLSFNAMAGLLTLVYYGRAAEERGRKLVLFLSAVGITLMLLVVVLICQLLRTGDVVLANIDRSFRCRL